MNASRFDRQLDAWFDSVEPLSAPADVLTSALESVRRTRQHRGLRGALQTLVAERPRMLPAAVSPSLAVVLVALALMLALLGAAIVGALPHLLLPPPFEGVVAEGFVGARQDTFIESRRRLVLVLPDGGRQPLHAVGPSEACASLSPDRRRLAYYTAPPEPDGSVAWQVESQSDDTGIRLVVADALAGAAWRELGGERLRFHALSGAPAWSPAGDALVVIAHSLPDDEGGYSPHLAVVPLDGGPARVIAGPLRGGAQPDEPFTFASLASWSPDGQWIAVRTRNWPDPRAQAPLYGVAVIRPDGSELRILTEWPVVGSVPVESLAWSPDSRWLAYNRQAADVPPHGWDIHVVSIEGTDRRLTATSANEVVAEWSPDGTRIATHFGATVRVVEVAQPAIVDLSLPAAVSGATWSGDGAHLIVATGLEQTSVWQIDAQAGAAAQQLIALADHAPPLCALDLRGLTPQEVP